MAASPSSTSIDHRLHHEHWSRCPTVLQGLTVRSHEPHTQLPAVVAAPAVDVIVGADSAGVLRAGRELLELDRRAIGLISSRLAEHLLHSRRAVAGDAVADLAIVVVTPAPGL